MNENFRIQTLFLGVDSLPYFLSTNFLQRKMLFLFQDAYINVEGKKKKKRNQEAKGFISRCYQILQVVQMLLLVYASESLGYNKKNVFCAGEKTQM